MRSPREILGANLERLRNRISNAAGRAGRSVEDVRLVAVTKEVEVEIARELFDLGVKDLGENRPQELWRKRSLMDRPVSWHLVGTLQRNKARRTLPLVDWIHSVDSSDLLRRLDSLAMEMELKPRVLLQVNTSGEATKHGFSLSEMAQAMPAISELRQVHVRGFMTMAPYDEQPERVREYFARLRDLRDYWAGRAPAHCPLTELSMGMSGDFELAIEEGATMIRIGSALFEGLVNPT